MTGEQQEAPVVSLTPGMLLAKQAIVHLLVWLLEQQELLCSHHFLDF